MEQAIIGIGKGKLLIQTEGMELFRCCFVVDTVNIDPGIGYAKEVAVQLEEYFSGSRRVFDVKLKRWSNTPIKEDIYNALMLVPYGTTISYGKLAELSGHKGCARIVGSAMKDNPFMIIVPCHRVIKSSGELGEYVGSAELKERLLRAEGAIR